MASVRAGFSHYLAGRTHRSFRLTRRRDYVRPLVLPGYLSFTAEVVRTIWSNRKVFIPLLLVYLVLYIVLVGISSQGTYSTIVETVQEAGAQMFDGNLSSFTEALAVMISVGSTGGFTTLTDLQQVLSILLLLMMWLSIVWLLRNRLAGHAVKMRDGLYNSAAPLFASIVVVAVIILQSIPIMVAMIGYSAASATGLLDGGVEAMLFWMAAGTLVMLSLYWVIGSLFALIVVTLPGMYPWPALMTSFKIVSGRRATLILRALWMILIAFTLGGIVLLSTILLSGWLASIWSWVEVVPLTPAVATILGGLGVLWMSTYVYLLYRKVVDNE